MKQRIISGIVAFCLLALAVVLFNTGAFAVIIIAVAALCAYELGHAFGLKESWPLAVTALLAFIAPTGLELLSLLNYSAIVLAGFIILWLTITVIRIKSLSADKSALMLAISLVFALGFYSFSAIRQTYANHGYDGCFLMFCCFALPLLGDMFALIFGMKFGKKPLAPEISPHKTRAGAIAAVALSPLYSALVLFIYSLTPFFREGALSAVPTISLYIAFAALGVVVSAFGIVGDLFASCVKRVCGIKDFGNIMPGHGGAVDRLDSVMFTSTFVACFACLILPILF